MAIILSYMLPYNDYDYFQVIFELIIVHYIGLLNINIGEVSQWGLPYYFRLVSIYKFNINIAFKNQLELM